MPVREIAQLAGVSERTLYKYVVRYGWRKRYRVLPRGVAAAAANRGRRAAPENGYAPVKGAGARFIRREDNGKPFAAGLKALDAAGHARADAVCAEAQARADRAEAEAELDHWSRETLRARAEVNRAMGEALKMREDQKENPRGWLPGDAEMMERAMASWIAAAADALEATTAERDRALLAVRAVAWGLALSSPSPREAVGRVDPHRH